MQGDITITSDGTLLTVSMSKNPKANVWIPGNLSDISSATISDKNSAPTFTTASESSDITKAPLSQDTASYIGNKNTRKLHYPSCSSVGDMKESNKIFFFGERDEPIDQGYIPCKRCEP